MIVSKDIHPQRDFYYLGAKVIEILSNSDSKSFDFFDLFGKIKSSENISINLFAITLDWLYLIGTINQIEKGNIVKCF